MHTAQVTTDFAYLPFGGGRRKCIGDQFALFESVVALAVLLRRFTLRKPADALPVGMTTGATIHTTAGLWMELHPRVPGDGGSNGRSRGEDIDAVTPRAAAVAERRPVEREGAAEEEAAVAAA